MLCPHTACGVAAAEWFESEQQKPVDIIALATAHPAKFDEAVRSVCRLLVLYARCEGMLMRMQCLFLSRWDGHSCGGFPFLARRRRFKKTRLRPRRWWSCCRYVRTIDGRIVHPCVGACFFPHGKAWHGHVLGDGMFYWSPTHC